MTKNKRTTPAREFKHSPPTSASPISELNLGLIIHAVKVCRSLVGDDGARERWNWHPLYETAVAAIDNQLE